MINDSYCDAELRGPAKKAGQTVVLNPQRWNSILQHLHRGEDEQMANDAENQYREYLRKESKAMTQKWDNSVEAIRKKRLEEKAKINQEKILEGKNEFNQFVSRRLI